MKAFFINASPRKNWNTAKLLREAMRGAEDAGAEVEFVNLFDFEFTGCRACFACKLKNSKTDGVCAVHDSIRPLLEKLRHADVVIFGSPVYYSYPTGQFRNLLERFLFPRMTYNRNESGYEMVVDKKIKTGLIFTMNATEEQFNMYGFESLLAANGKTLEIVCGHNETMYVFNTYQFTNYDKYNANAFSEESKRKYRDEHFPIDLQNSYELGKRLAS